MSETETDTDLQLLARYTCDHAEDAFAEIVRRHLDLVHSAALRQVRSPQLAEEVAQSVFTDLARSARRLAPDTILTAWLYQVTRRTAIDVVRREARRQLREQIATEMNALNETAHFAKCGAPPNWADIEPLLDEAMSALDDTDRAAVLLRYFEDKSLHEVGQSLGTSDAAAQKRVSRAVERLREFFAMRGVTIGASGLVAVISANAVQAAPVGLAVTISTAAALAGATLAATATATAIKTIAMTTLQKTLVTVTVAVLAGAGIYEANQASNSRAQVQTLQQRQVPLAQQIQQLTRERNDVLSKLAGLRDDNERLNRNTAELLKLRGEVGVLRRELAGTKDLVESSNDLAKTWTIGQTKWSKDWKNAGRDSPEAAFETYHWAAANTNFQTMRQCLIFDYGTNTESPPEVFATRKVRSELIEISHGLTGGIRLYSVKQWSNDRAGIEIEKMERRGVEAVRPGINGTEDHYFKLSDPPEWDLRKDTVNLLKVDGEWKVIENTPDRLTLTTDDEDSNAVAEMMMKMGPNELEQIKTKVPLRTLRAYEALKAKGTP